MTCVAVHDELITIPGNVSKSQIIGILKGHPPADFLQQIKGMNNMVEIPGDPNLFSH